MRMAASSWTFFRNVIALSLAHSLHVIRHLAGNLSHRQSIGSACGPPNVHASSRQFHKAENDQTGQTGSVRRSHREEFAGHDLMPMSLEELFCAPPKTPEKRPCAPEDGIRKMASLTARNRLFHDIVPDFRDRPAMENRVRFSYAYLPAIDRRMSLEAYVKAIRLA